MGNITIFVKNKLGNIEDKTLEIQSYEFADNKYLVKYKNSNNIYTYSLDKFFICHLVQTISLNENELLFLDNKAYSISSVDILEDTIQLNKIVSFQDANKNFAFVNPNVSILEAKETLTSCQKFIVRRNDGFIFNNVDSVYIFAQYYKVIFHNQTSKIYPSSAIQISLLYDKVGAFEYFKQISEELISPENELSSFLSHQYSNLFVDDLSIFYNFLKEPKVIQTSLPNHLVFPFHFNNSQIDATKNGLTSNISVIEGPPGTGKTETILNILMNLIMQNKTVAVVSGNNYAVENIRTKLKEYNLDFLTALLGNSDNRAEFFDTSHSIPDLSSYNLDDDIALQLQNQVTTDIDSIEDLLRLNNELANLKLQLSNLENEFLYFEDNFKNSKVKPLDFSNLDLKQLSNLLVETYIIPRKLKISFLNKLKLFFKYRFVYFNDLANNPEKVQLNLQRYLYIIKKINLKAQIVKIQKQLEDKSFDSLNENIQENSMKLLYHFLFRHYQNCKQMTFDNDFSSENYYLRHFEDFIKIHPIILSTVHSLKNCSGDNFLYDYIIIDEASQTDLVAAGIALSCAKNVIIVGDLKQLSHIVPENVKKKIEHLSEAYQINPCYDYAKHNILSCVKSLYKDLPSTLLREHYRCHPKIIEFCNHYFYDDQLIIHTSGTTVDEPLILIESAKGSTSREDENKKLLNLRQVEECLRYFPKINQENFDAKEIGFIAPFNAQVNLAKKHLEKDIFKSTINKFQGQECKIIIFSTVLDHSSRTNAMRLKFVNDNRLVNVAVSRAKKRFVLIANKHAFTPGSTIAELTNYMQYNCLSKSIIESDVYSIFDLMYREYSDKLLDICVEKIQKISPYPSENLANYVIQDVLSEPKYKFLDCVFSISLKQLIKNFDLLTEEEKHFVYDTSSEVDFVIYDKNNHMPVLVVEVDGYAFHHKPIDKKRDSIKNTILNKYHISFLRLPTDSSNERNKLISALDDIINSADEIN